MKKLILCFLLALELLSCKTPQKFSLPSREIASADSEERSSIQAQLKCLRVLAPVLGHYTVWPFGFQGDWVIRGKTIPNVRANLSYVDAKGKSVQKEGVFVFTTNRQEALNSSEQAIVDAIEKTQFRMISVGNESFAQTLKIAESILSDQGVKDPHISMLYYSNYARDYFASEDDLYLLNHPDIPSSEAPVFKIRKNEWVGYVRPSIVGDIGMVWDSSKKPFTPEYSMGFDDSESRAFQTKIFTDTSRKMSQYPKLGGEPVVDVVSLSEGEVKTAENYFFESFKDQLTDLYYLVRKTEGKNSEEVLKVLQSPECESTPKVKGAVLGTIHRIRNEFSK